jgi:hypothetical protein
MIDPRYYGLIELVIFGALALGVGFWQLRSVDRELKRSREEAEKQDRPD